jgi:DNA-binding MarR family transcriptional regulator
MPASRFSLMRVLALSSVPVGTTDLARRLGINAAAVTRQLQYMERDHLIRRRTDRRDGRRCYVSLTPRGKKVFEDLHSRTHDLETTLVMLLGADEMLRAAELLKRLRTFLEDPRRGEGTHED